MRDWTDEELTTLLADTMVLHEVEADPVRARELARGVRPTKRHWPAAAAASIAVVLVCGAVVYAVAGKTDETAAPPTGRTASSPGPSTVGDAPAVGTTQENYQRAVAASEAAVSSVPMPDGSVQLDGEPSDWPDGGMALGPSDATLTRTAWWSAPMTMAQVEAFLTDHAPPGTRHPVGEDVIGPAGSDGVAWTEYDVIAPADPAAYTGPTVLVQYTQLGDHTVLRVDTFLAARHAVSAAHRITGDVTSVTIDRVRPQYGSDAADPRPSVQLTAPADAAQVARLVDAFNGLYGSITATGVMSCPMIPSPPPREVVTFEIARPDGGADALEPVVATLEPMCWGQLHVSVDGTPLDVTLDPGGWSELVNEVADAS